MTLLVHFYFSWKRNKIHWLDFLKVHGWYRTCRRLTANVYALFKAFRLQKYHVQDHYLELYNLFKNQGLQNLTVVFVTKLN